MTSKTSCFNSGLLRRSLLKGAPLWGLWLLFWLLAMPVYMLTRQDLAPFELTQYLYSFLVVIGTFGVFFTAWRWPGSSLPGSTAPEVPTTMPPCPSAGRRSL